MTSEFKCRENCGQCCGVVPIPKALYEKYKAQLPPHRCLDMGELPINLEPGVFVVAFTIAIFIGVVLGIIVQQPTCGLPPCPTNLLNWLPILSVVIFVAIVLLLIILDMFASDYWRDAEPARLQEQANLKLEAQKLKERMEKAGVTP